MATGQLVTPRGEQRASAVGIALLAVLSLSSLGLVSTVDDIAHGAVMRLVARGPRHAEWLVWLVEARVVSAIVCVLLYLGITRLVRADRVPAISSATWRRPGIVAAGWLVGTVIAIHGVGVYVPPLPRTVDVAAFMVFGLLAEEMLFRGALFALAGHVFPSRTAVPVVWTAVLFSLQHLQYHHYHVSAQAITQVAYTFPLGLVLGYVRSATGRLLPAIGVHVVNNAIALL